MSITSGIVHSNLPISCDTVPLPQHPAAKLSSCFFPIRPTYDQQLEKEIFLKKFVTIIFFFYLKSYDDIIIVIARLQDLARF